MAVPINCSLNKLLSPPSTSAKTPQLSCPRKERSWKSQCVIGIACIVISLETGRLTAGTQENAIAGEIPLAVESRAKLVHRWSDKRSCPPWRANSLENIVPENLPRPTARRKWEWVGFSDESVPAPAVKFVRKGSTGCFTM